MQRWDREQGIESHVEAVRGRFEQWRQGGRLGRRIPNGLWKAAVALARRQGVCRTAAALGLNATALKARLGTQGPSAVAAAAKPVRFVELAVAEAAGAVGAGWHVEIEDGRGAKLRISAGAGAAPDLGELTRAFLREPR